MNILANKKVFSVLSFLIPFSVYVLTLAPGLYFIDTGELAAACVKLGIAHPTGYPLFTLIGKVFTLLPAGENIYKLNLMCAFLTASTVFKMFHLVHYVISDMDLNETGNNKGVFKKFVSNELLINLVSLSASLVLAFSNTFWNVANSLEVYSLHTLLIVTVIFVFLKASDIYVHGKGKDDLRYWFLFAFVLGLSFTNHLTTIFLGVGFLYLYFAVNGLRKQSFIKILYMAVPFALAFSVYAYFFIRADNNSISWDYPANLSNFYRHISGKQFSVWMFSSTEAASKQFSHFVSVYPKEFFYFPVIIALFGLVYSFFRQRRFFYFTLLLFVFNILYAINYDIHDIDTYFLLAYIITAVWFALGLIFIVDKLKLNNAIIVILAVFLPALCVYSNFEENDESKSVYVREYTENVFNSARNRSIVFSTQWDFWVSASFYLQMTENYRPDVAVLDKELMRRSWYMRHIRIHYPEIYERSRQEFEDYNIELLKFEKETDRYTNPKTESDKQNLIKIQNSFAALLNSIVDRNYKDYNVYMTFEIDDTKNERFALGYKRIPEGLLLRLTESTDFDSTYSDPEIKFVKTNRTDYYHSFLMNAYYMMFLNRASYLMNFSKLDVAENYVKRALELKPNDKTGMGMLRRINDLRGLK